MSMGRQDLLARLDAHLSAPEREGGVVYAVSELIPHGTLLRLPHMSLRTQADVLLAFVDREPLANWGHACRFVLIDGDTGETTTVEARFPPFGSLLVGKWEVVYRASSVPDSAIAIAK